MSKYFSPLKLKDILTLLGLLLLGVGWVQIDQLFLHETSHRFIALIVLIFIIFSLQYAINKPVNIIKYCNSIALLTVSVVILIIVILDILIHHNFSFKLVLIWIISALLPYISGFVYAKLKRKQAAK